MADYGLDMHGNLILDEYRQMRPALQKMKEVALSIIRKDIADKNLMVTATEARVKEEGSLAGMLELADEQFCVIRRDINDYRRRVQSLVSDGRLEEVALDGDTFKSYLAMQPFDTLNRRIAALNQAEIQEVPLQRYLPVLKDLGMTTLGDVEQMIRSCQEDAYRLASYQLGVTDIDIITSAVAIQNLCIVTILRNGGGKPGLQSLFDTINGQSEANASLAEMIYHQAENLKLI